jgi:hypothetical protein
MATDPEGTPMTHRAAAALTVALHHLRLRLAPATGQGTVEYVGLILLIAGVLATVVTFGKGFNGADLGNVIVGKLKEAINGVAAKG